jgi:hypothetical protein
MPTSVHRAHESGETRLSCPAKAGKGDHPKGGGRGVELNDTLSTTAKRRVRRPLHHASHGPPPPLSRGRISAPVLAARMRPSFCKTPLQWKGEGERGGKRRGGACRFLSATLFAGSSLRGAKRRSNPVPRRRPGLLRGACHRAGHFGPDPLARNDEKGSGTPTDASYPRAVSADTAAHPAGCARLSAFHRGSDPREFSSQRPSFRPCFLGRGLAPIL